MQRDWDGTPMPTDMMSDETCRVLARALGERNQGIQQLTLTTSDVRHDMSHLEEIASALVAGERVIEVLTTRS